MDYLVYSRSKYNLVSFSSYSIKSWVNSIEQICKNETMVSFSEYNSIDEWLEWYNEYSPTNSITSR